jgi:multiple sugar transport system ATP-binding protein
MGAPKINLLAQPGSAAELAHQALWKTLAGERLAGAKHLGVRPEHLQVHASGEGVAATVVLAEHLGDASVLHMRVQGVAELLKAKVAANSGAFQAGQMVFLRAPADAVLGFDAAGKAL